MEKPEEHNGVSNEAVLRATGKEWTEWFTILDAWDATSHPHAEIADYLYTEQKVSAWWCQMVTVGYEQARGLRVKHQKTDGFSVGVSKTFPHEVGKVFAAWEEEARRKWLAEDLTITKQTTNKSIRAKLLDDTRVNVGFYPGRGKVQVALEHEKLKSTAQVEKQRAFWKKAFERLAAYLG